MTLLVGSEMIYVICPVGR